MPAIIWQIGESVVEPNKFKYVIMVAGQEHYSNVYLAQPTKHD